MFTSLSWKDEIENTRYTLDSNAFETRMQVDEYIAALKQNILPLKLANVGRAAYNHDLLIRSQEYALTSTETALLKATLATAVLTKFNSSGLNVIDVGSGNGMKAAAVLEILHQKFSRLKYVGLDYSKELLQMAVRYISTQLGELNATTFQIDFEKGAFHERNRISIVTPILRTYTRQSSRSPTSSYKHSCKFSTRGYLACRG